jgi:phosphoglycerate dehydrogenase-like enzyme
MSGSRPKVLVVDKISQKTRLFSRKYLTPDADLFFTEDFDQQIATANVLVSNTAITKEMLDRAPKCFFLQKYGTGMNNVAVSEATKRGIPVANAPGKNAQAVAEYALMLMLAVYKNIITAHNKLAKEGLWLKSVLRDRCYELSHKTVGIVGLGNIGRRVARLLKGFECDLVYYDVARIPQEQEKELGVRYADLDTLIRESDVVSLHVPLLPETQQLIDERRLKLMKPNAILVNTSRGPVIDEKALIEVLQSGHLLGAGIDAFATEPADQNNPLMKLDNVVVSPHNGGGTNESIEAVVRFGCENINAMLKDGTFAHESSIVNLNELPARTLAGR